MRKIIAMLTLLLFVMFPARVDAIIDPLEVPNNKFGIHIISESDISEAQELVNSSGGDWGYVTLVIRADERNTERWQRAFDDMRRRHLIPIVRIASTQGENGWEKLDQTDISDWLQFFDSLNWVVQNRYLVVGNEVNHATEWGGEINPSEYASYLRAFYTNAKASNQDYFILPAGLDASAPNSRDHMSEDSYLWQMKVADPDIFNYMDGWNSHSYPNPEFSGSANAIGRGTVRTFEWELSYLRGIGVNRELPIFITETGWKHDVGGQVLGYKSDSEIVTEYTTAFTGAWSDDRIVAVTPFVLGYSEEPFKQFSWKKNEGGYHAFYHKVKSIAKTSGTPSQISKGELLFEILPNISGNENFVLARVKNIGQNIWQGGEQIEVEFGNNRLQIKPLKYLKEIEPGESGIAFVRQNHTGGVSRAETYSVGLAFKTFSQFNGIASVMLSKEYETTSLN